MFKRLILNFYKRSITREIRLLNHGDKIKLHPKVYKEAIYFSKDAVICGDQHGTTKIKGNITIPKGRVVEFQNVTFYPNVKIKIEGKAIFRNCHLKGLKTDVLVTVHGGMLEAYHCKFSFAKKYAMELISGTAILEHCHFSYNIESHIFMKQSKVVISQCEFSKSNHALLINEKSFVDMTQSKLYHHDNAQIVVNQSKFYDFKSFIQNGNTGLIVENESEVNLTKSIFQNHSKHQIQVENSIFTAEHSHLKNGKQSGLFVNNGEASLRQCLISNHFLSNVQLVHQSRIHIVNGEISDSKGFGVEATDESILNFDKTKIMNNKLAQITISDRSVCSMNQSIIKGGCHVGIFIEKSNCTLVNSVLTENENSAFNVLNGELHLINCDVAYNFGNGIMALNDTSIEIDQCRFYHNVLPHVACKSNVKVSVQKSQFRDGKSIFLTKHCELFVSKTKFCNSEQVQIDISEGSSGYIDDSFIINGKSKGISVTKNSNLSLYNCQISNHKLSQLYVNDSSVILKNCEIYKGKQYGISVQNRSEVYIQESYISNHLYSQIWIDKESIVELNCVQLTDGQQTDVYVQNQSAVYVAESIIRNEKTRFNLQAINHSKIEIIKTYIENKFGEIFYSQNNSFIKFDT